MVGSGNNQQFLVTPRQPLVGILTEIAGMSFFSMNHQHGTADFANIGEQRHIDE